MHIFILLIVLLVSSWTNSARILGIFPFEGRSHFIMFESLCKALAERGHDVVVISHFPQKAPVANYTDRSLVGTRPLVLNSFSMSFLEQHMNFWSVIKYILENAGVDLCEEMYQHSVFQDLIHNNEKFDLVINELWGSDCFLALAHKLDVPHISMTTTVALPWAMTRYGNPLNTAYETSYFTAFRTSGMNFQERLINTLMINYLNLRHYFTSEIPSDAIARKYIGPSTPPLRDIIQNSSLMMVNGHFSLFNPRPFVPNIIEVGGIHIAEPKELPKELKDFLDNSSKHGVILFSLGSLIQPETFREETIQGILEAIAILPYNVLWKFGGDIKEPPSNLKIVKWLPQNDVLHHSNIKLFITHGGLMGTQEAIHAGVPLLVIPFFGDQPFNSVNYVDMGIAEQINYDELTKDTFLNTVTKILNNKTYAESAKYYSSIFKDRPLSAMNTAIYWTEYVIRYKGAPHLQSAVKKLSWLQSSLLDVYGFLLCSLLTVLYLFHKILVMVLNFLKEKEKVE